MLAEPVSAPPEDWAVLQLVAYRFVVEMPEWRLLLPSSPGAPIIAMEFGAVGQYPIDWDPELFALVKQGCAGLGAQPKRSAGGKAPGDDAFQISPATCNFAVRGQEPRGETRGAC